MSALKSDDSFADPNVLSRIASAMRDPLVDTCRGALVQVAKDDMRKILRCWKSREYQSGLCHKCCMPACPAFCARRSVCKRFGGFDLSFTLQADFEMALRLLDVKSLRTPYLPEVLVRMRMGSASTTSLRNVIRGDIEVATAYRRHGFPGRIPFVARKFLLRIPQFVRRPPTP